MPRSTLSRSLCSLVPLLAGLISSACVSPPAGIGLDAPPPGDASDSGALSCDPYYGDPVSRGRCALAAVTTTMPVAVLLASDPAARPWLDALDAAGAQAPRGPEAFALVSAAGALAVVGSDEAGAMYGAFELAERAQLYGPSAFDLRVPVTRAPLVPVRAANLFLTLPAAGEGYWWFLDRDFWREYMDLLADARINVLDLHGMYNGRNTIFPNALLYFATSASFPAVGVAAAERSRNLDTLVDVIAMARARGIRVDLMTYRSDTSPLGDGVEALSDPAQLAQYTREASEDLARRATGLWKLGFRVGESGRDAAWFARYFVAGVRAAGTGVGVSTRTWGTDPPGIAAVIQATGGELLLEAKFNGEHLGVPYPVLASNWAGWANYQYEGYLDAPSTAQLVFQVRAGGTHRAFRQASYEQARRAVRTTTHAGAAGFTLEAAHAYMPQRSFQHVNPTDDFSPWTFRRDELAYLLWGRLGYDSDTPELVFRARLARRVGNDALWAPMQAASAVLPWIMAGELCGPDQRDYAPELEWGGEIAYLATTPAQNAPYPRACRTYHGPMDPFAIAGAWETAIDLATGASTARLTTRDVAAQLTAAAQGARAAAAVTVDPGNPEARDVQRECVALADLGDYHAHRMRGATALAVYTRTGDTAWREVARSETRAAGDAWRALAGHTAYFATFDEPLRMAEVGIESFHWREESPWMDDDARALEAAIATAAAQVHDPAPLLPSPDAWLAGTRAEEPAALGWAVTPMTHVAPTRQLTVRLARALPAGASVSLWWKPVAAPAGWNRVDAMLAGDQVTAQVVTGAARGFIVALELRFADGSATRLPDVRRDTPWVVLVAPATAGN